jgi:predicted ribosome quality control (RQC) complex YloA/Tae2 family protein
MTHTKNLPVSTWLRLYYGRTNFGQLNVRSKSKSLVRDAYDSNFERGQSLRLSQQRAEKAENEVARLKAELEALKKSGNGQMTE